MAMFHKLRISSCLLSQLKGYDAVGLGLELALRVRLDKKEFCQGYTSVCGDQYSMHVNFPVITSSELLS